MIVMFGCGISVNLSDLKMWNPKILRHFNATLGCTFFFFLQNV